MANITTPIYIYDRDEQLRLILNNLPGNFDGLAVNEQNRNLTQSAGMFIGTMEVPHKQPIPQSDSGFLPYKNGWITEQLNGAVTLEFDVFANHPSAALIVNDGRAVTKDIDGNYMEFIIRVIDDNYGSGGTFKRVEAEGAEYELIDEFLPEYTQASVDLETALKAVTQGTRIEIGDVDYLGQKPVSLKNMSVKRAVYELLNLFGAERRLRVEIAGNRIVRRYLDALEHRGKNTGKRWEAGKDIISSTRTINSETVKTALYGRGASQENDQPRLTFSEIEWVKANGDPTDKPLGQTWVGDVNALHTWGYEHGTRHKFGLYDGQENDPGVLLLNTWNDLQKIVRTTDTYDVTVIQLGEILDYEHEKVRLGDISYAINREVYPSMETEASVIEYRHNLNQSDLSECTLGMFRAKFDLSGRFNNVEKDHNENRGNWTKKETPAAAQEKADVAKSGAITEAQVRIDAAKIKLDADITEAENRIAQAEIDIDTAEQDLLAAQGRLDTNDTAISNAKSDITSAKTNISNLETDLTTKVGTDGVIPAINNSTDRIYGKNLRIDGDALITGTLGASQATFLDLTTKRMTAIDATIDNATISGTLNANAATFNNGTFNSAYMVSMTTRYGRIIDATMQDVTITGNITSTYATFLNATINDATINNATITGNLVGVTGTFTGEIVGGSITSNTDINVTRDVTIGNNLTIGVANSVNKKIIMNGYNESLPAVIEAGVYGGYGTALTLDAVALYVPNGLIYLDMSRSVSLKKDGADGDRVKLESTGAQVWLDPGGNIYFLNSGVVKHTFFSGGTKAGGSIEIDGTNLGMSPVDSPQTRISTLIMDVELLAGVEKEIAFESRFAKAITQYAVLPSQPIAIRKETGKFYAKSEVDCTCDFNVDGYRVGHENTYWQSMEI